MCLCPCRVCSGVRARVRAGVRACVRVHVCVGARTPVSVPVHRAGVRAGGYVRFPCPCPCCEAGVCAGVSKVKANI